MGLKHLLKYTEAITASLVLLIEAVHSGNQTFTSNQSFKLDNMYSVNSSRLENSCTSPLNAVKVLIKTHVTPGEDVQCEVCEEAQRFPHSKIHFHL